MPSVSISSFNPYRVFKFAATSKSIAMNYEYSKVSIPIGFSSSLQHWAACPGSERIIRFQSLSGFQVRCNTSWWLLMAGRSWSFNPYRVFKFAATNALASIRHRRARVSIPIGFSSSLQLRPVRRASRTSTSFNPYRVFKFAATPRFWHYGKPSTSVSIPIGFSSSLQHVLCYRFKRHWTCFNPYRVFKFAATERQWRYKVCHDLFQSLSGFQVRCNIVAPL